MAYRGDLESLSFKNQMKGNKMTKSLDEKVADKMGWVQSTLEPSAWSQGKGYVYGELPSFSTDWNATKILIKFMRERGFGYEVSAYNDKLGHYFFWYGQVANSKFPDRCRAEIIDDDLPLAACEAFLLIDLEVE